MKKTFNATHFHSAHRNNYEILKMLLDRGASIPGVQVIKLLFFAFDKSSKKQGFSARAYNLVYSKVPNFVAQKNTLFLGRLPYLPTKINIKYITSLSLMLLHNTLYCQSFKSIIIIISVNNTLANPSGPLLMLTRPKRLDKKRRSSLFFQYDNLKGKKLITLTLVPHDVKCGCDECVEASNDDSLRFKTFLDLSISLYRYFL